MQYCSVKTEAVSVILRSMPDWIDLLATAINLDQTAILVTVIAVEGSAPREIGASLIVSTNGVGGTIGGGNLEHTSVKRARELLLSDVQCEIRWLALGPSLGQCCGGRVELLFEHVTDETPWFQKLIANCDALSSVPMSENSHWLCREIDGETALFASTEEIRSQLQIPGDVVDLGCSACLVFSKEHDARWLCMPLTSNPPKVWVYGAGHVGQAVVAQLELLDCSVSLLDHREDWQALQPDLKISRILSDAPEDEVSYASTDTYHVVMTHSHTLDFEICHAILKRDDFAWLGLIGSATKRQTFCNRLSQRGISDRLLKRLCCPIGNLQLESSVPSVIALNLAAELASLWQQTGKLR